VFRFTKNIEDYGNQIFEASKYIGQGFSVTFDHMNRKPITIHYPYGELIPTERFRGRIHFEFDKCIACEVCVRVCPNNLHVVDWEYKPSLKKKKLKSNSKDICVCIFCGN
jgi:NAD(P)H-quinone oxidoreductase subunit I